MKILCVDDCEDIRFILRKLLQDYGFEVYLAENGRQALEVLLAPEHSFFAVITDFNMPFMNGKELIETIIFSKIKVEKVLVCSAMIENESAFNDLGELDFSLSFIRKPFPLSTLLDGLNSI